jgi:hypothetical protein
VLVDIGSSADIMYNSIFDQMGLTTQELYPTRTTLISFSGDTLYSLGMISLEVKFGRGPCTVTLKLTFLVVGAPSAYNAILGRGALNKLGAIASIPHLMMKFLTPNEIGCEQEDQELLFCGRAGSFARRIKRPGDTRH